MRSSGNRLIQKYIVNAIVPYFFLSLLLLTTVLYLQQSSRFAEILLLSFAPRDVVAGIALSLLPGALAFTIPMAVLAGTVIGFSRMRSDSELVAIRAAGVSSLSILLPPLMIGLLMSLIAFFINFEAAPTAAHQLRRAGLEAALHKLDSPVEPRTFNTEIPGYVLYVGEGDKLRGTWGRVFIFAQNKDGTRALVTAASGRIDAAASQSELVLTDAVKTTLPGDANKPEGQYITERITDTRIILDTGRKGILARLQEDDPHPDEMGMVELMKYTRMRTDVEARESATMLHRKFSLTLAPLIFALLGGTLSLHLKRVGRGWGSLLSLVTLIAYYMLSLFGDGLARKGAVPPFVGAWMSTVAASLVSLLLIIASRWGLPMLVRSPTVNDKLPDDARGRSEWSAPRHILKTC